MNKLFLALVGLFNPLWSRLGADPHALRLILRTKLIMDDRGGLLLGKRQANANGMEWLMYIFMLLFGFMFVGLFFLTDDRATAVGLGFSVWLIYLGMILIVEMSEHLFDQRDLYVLLSRPVTDVTLSLSRMLHIGVFTSKLALCLGLPTFGYLLFWGSPWAAVVYTLTAAVTVVLAITLTLVTYLTLIRRVSPGRVKKIVGYFQIIASLLFFTAYQLPSLLGDVKQFVNITLVDNWAGFVFPGLWVGGLFKTLTTTAVGPLGIGQAMLALAAAGFGGWYYVRQSRDYGSNLLALRHSSEVTDNEQEKPAEPGETAGAVAPSLRARLARLLTRPNQERASFNFHWRTMLRDMGFKQRTYPGLVYVPVILAITVGRDALKGDEEFVLGEGSMIMLLYFLLWAVIVPLQQTRISEHYRAAWIFEATPNAFTNRIQYGRLMAVLAMFFLPVAVVVYTVVPAYFGLSTWLDILLSLANVLIFVLVYGSVDGGHPFSRSKDDAKFEGIGPFFLVAILGSVMGAGHYFLRSLPYALPVLTVVAWAILLGWLAWLRRRDVRNVNS